MSVSVGTVLIDNIIFTCYTEIISCMVGDSMSRQPRVAGEYLHIIVRGIGKQLLFEDTRDNEKYLFFLKKYAACQRGRFLMTTLVILKSSGLSIRQIERLTGINRGVIQKAKSCQPEPSP